MTASRPDSGASSDVDRELASRVRARDVAAFEALYRRYAGAMVRFAYSQLGSREAAEDVVQELFLGLWRHRENWVPSDSVRAYLFGALRNRIVSHRRALAARGPRRHVGPGSAASLPSSSSADHGVREAELIDAIERAVAGLSPRCRETFRLVRQEHLSYAQAAEVLGVSVKAVEMNMVRALAALRKQLAEWCD
ncbi:MAG TPA: sigma-70 family RNA polymerase sigma factor [Longimicrobiales bacterium]